MSALAVGSVRIVRFARFAWWILAFNVLVILWGAFVRASGSGAGCGSHWPLCDGDVIPDVARLATKIEFSHRVSSGIAFVLVLAMAVWSFRVFPRGSVVRRSATWAAVFMAGEAIIGAGLVLLRLVEHDKSVLRVFSISLHLSNTFLLLGALVLTAWWASGGGRVRLRGQGALAFVALVPLAAMFAVGISGAIAALGDTLFPASSLAEGLAQDAAPAAHFLVKLRIVHPFVAGATTVVILVAAALARMRRPSDAVRRASRVASGLAVLQVACGLVNWALLAPSWMQLVHLLLADLVWLALVWMSAASLSAEAPASAGASAGPYREPAHR